MQKESQEPFIASLERQNACQPFIDWVRSNNVRTLQEAMEKMKVSHWGVWTLRKCGYAESDLEGWFQAVEEMAVAMLPDGMPEKASLLDLLDQKDRGLKRRWHDLLRQRCLVLNPSSPEFPAFDLLRHVVNVVCGEPATSSEEIDPIIVMDLMREWFPPAKVAARWYKLYQSAK